VDLNDAPAGVAKDQQQDGRRELPAATGVIEVAGFLNALDRRGYAAPCAPSHSTGRLNDLDNEPACAATMEGLKKAVALMSRPS